MHSRPIFVMRVKSIFNEEGLPAALVSLAAARQLLAQDLRAGYPPAEGEERRRALDSLEAELRHSGTSSEKATPTPSPRSTMKPTVGA